MAEKKTAILVRCTEQEAQAIRRCARAERRTISGFILNAVRNRVETHNRMAAQRAAEQAQTAEARGVKPGASHEN